MSEIKSLIKELCPMGVSFDEIGNILDYIQPTNYIVKDTNYNDNNKTPVLTAGQTFILGYTNEVDGIFISTKETPVIIFDDFTTSFQWVDFNFKVKSSAMKILVVRDSSTVNLRYIYHAMKTIGYKPKNHSRQWIEKFSRIEIPLPPKRIQDEIVIILDSLENLTNNLILELNKEIAARQKQYEYYRDKLLTFKEVGNESI